METSIWVNPENQGVIFTVQSENGMNSIIHFKSISEAIKKLQEQINCLRQAIPIEDLPESYGQTIAELLDEEFSLRPSGKEHILRLKLVKSTKNFHVYEECDYQDQIQLHETRRIGMTYLSKKLCDEIPPEFLSGYFRPSPEYG